MVFVCVCVPCMLSVCVECRVRRKTNRQMDSTKMINLCQSQKQNWLSHFDKRPFRTFLITFDMHYELRAYITWRMCGLYTIHCGEEKAFQLPYAHTGYRVQQWKNGSQQNKRRKTYTFKIDLIAGVICHVNGIYLYCILFKMRIFRFSFFAHTYTKQNGFSCF